MIAADTVFVGISELATLSKGPVPRRGPSMSELGSVEEAALAVRDGRVAWYGPERRLGEEVRLARGGSRVDLGGRCVLPGFVDAHTHLLFAGERSNEVSWKLGGASYADIASRGGGIRSTVRATRRAGERALLLSALDRLGRMLRSGTTTAEVKTGYALTLTGELRLLELIPRLAAESRVDLVATYLAAHAVPPEFEGRAEKYIDRIITGGLPEVARRRLARFCDVFCEPGFFDAPEAERLLTAAGRMGLGLKIHADEFVASGGTSLAARLEVRSAEHLLAAPREQFAALARAGVTAVLLPLTPFAALSTLRSPGRELVDAGVPVALGTDLSPNSWVESMPLVLSHAVYGARLTPAEAITAATVNSAFAIGAEESAGQLSVGRPADFSVFPFPRAEELPYRYGSAPEAVFRRGECVFSTKSERAFK